MRISANFQTFGYWGKPVPPAFSYSIASDAAVKAARKRAGALTNLRIIRADDAERRAIILDPSFVFPEAGNRPEDWVQPLGGDSFLSPGTGANRHDVGLGNDFEVYLQHDDGESHSVEGSRYISSTYQIPRNTPWSIRAALGEPPADQVFRTRVWWTRWGKWQFMVIDGKAYVALCSDAWTDENEFILTALMSLEEPTTEQREQMDAIRASIYEIWESFSPEPGGDGWYGTPFTLTFLPEPRGAVTILLGEGARWQEQTVEVPRILGTRKSGVLWEAGPLAISARGGAYTFQVGYPAFPETGVLRNGKFKNGYWADALGDLQLSSIGNSAHTDPVTLAGTSITIEREEINAVTSELVATFSTANPRLTPYAYALNALIEAGPRDGGETLAFDSGDAYSDTSPIKDAEPELDGDMRRSQYTVTLREINGGTFSALGSRYEVCENRTCNLTINGVRVITAGIIKSAELASMAQSTENEQRSEVTNPHTEVIVTICDQWAILEETILGEGDLIGDGLYLGAFIRRALRFAGIKLAEMSGVSATAGRRLPKGVAGESYAVISSDGQTVADMLRDAVAKWGMGLILYQNGTTGVWTLAKRSTSIATVGGHPAAFYPGSTTDVATYPGRFATLAPLDQVRDTDDFYNYFRVEGAVGADGKRIVAEWLTQESVTGGGNNQSRRFIGRIKKHPTVFDEGIRTQDEATYAVRSLYSLRGKPPRFHTFQTFYHVGLFPGDRITVHGVPCEIVSISGSIAADRMTISGREI